MFNLVVTYTSYVDNLEDTLAISEGGDVSSSILLVHSLAGKNLSNHVTHDSHHSGTAVVQLNIKLAGLLLRILDVSSEVSNTVVSIVLGGRHPCKLNKGEESKDLEKTGSGDSTDSVNSGGNIRELKVSRRAEVSIEYNVVVVNNGSNNGSHGNTSVLALNSTTTLEGLRLSLEPSKRIVNTKRLSNSKLKLAYSKGRSGLFR